MEERRIVVAHDAPTKYTIEFFNSITGKKERYVFQEYKRGSKRERTQTISEECYYFLKDETSAFKLGKLRVVTDNVPEEIKEVQKEAEQEVIDTTPEYEENILTREEIEKIMKGSKSNISKRLSGIESSTQKRFVVETIKELGVNNLDKLREVVRVLYGNEMELDLVFPPEE